MGDKMGEGQGGGKVHGGGIAVARSGRGSSGPNTLHKTASTSGRDACVAGTPEEYDSGASSDAHSNSSSHM